VRIVVTSSHEGEVDGEPTGPAFGRPDDRLRETAGEGRSDYRDCENPSPGLLAALVIRPLPKGGEVKWWHAYVIRFKLMRI
jgi:hypothetical protein